ncbi:MAG: NADH-quinone oxidoreductase subunit J [Planctomyces sp.]|nr:NADH-quinone oxidoreductase subunit J [Planctomyces sp.]
MLSIPPTLAATDIASYLPVLLLITIVVGFAATNLIASALLGPSRQGDIKAMTYESGMNPVGTARKRFNVRFYLIAMVFLVFDIEIIFLYPWAVTFRNLDPSLSDATVWLGRILFFILTTVVAYIYGYRKGVFRFD